MSSNVYVTKAEIYCGYAWASSAFAEVSCGWRGTVANDGMQQCVKMTPAAETLVILNVLWYLLRPSSGRLRLVPMSTERYGGSLRESNTQPSD